MISFATVLFSACSAVTVECCVLYPCCMGVFGMFAVMYVRRIFFITERRDMDLYEVPLFILAWSSGLSRGHEIEGSRVWGLHESESWPCVGAQVKDWSHVVIWMAGKITHTQYGMPIR